MRGAVFDSYRHISFRPYPAGLILKVPRKRRAESGVFALGAASGGATGSCGFDVFLAFFFIAIMTFSHKCSC